METELDFLTKTSTSLVLDVGANIGQTGKMLRRGGYVGRIISFEPIPYCFAKLAEAAVGDLLWDVRNVACGETNGPARIGVSENFVSSSILEATEGLISIHAPVRYTHYENITMVRIDSVLPEISQLTDRIHLKIDTQGFERHVMAGAVGALDRIGSVRMEVAVSEVYRGEMILPETITTMDHLGYILIDAWPAWRHPASGEVLHFDLLFRRKDATRS